MRIYVASSWRNGRQPSVVAALREAGHEVYDFKNPPNNAGFGWEEIHPDWKTWTPQQYLDALEHPRAIEGFETDMEALRECDACVLVLPSGRSAHLEAGWASGAHKTVVVLLDKERPIEPELMYSMAYAVCYEVPEVLAALEE